MPSARQVLTALMLAAWLCLLSIAPAYSAKLLVFAPASMTEVMADLKAQFEYESGNKVVISVAGTGQLARQLEAGAPAGVFISADKSWIEWLDQRKLLKSDTKIPIAQNELVLAVRNETENWLDVEKLLTESRFSMGEPNSVPAGAYARKALQNAGLWKKARVNAVYSENVRVTLRKVAMGEVGSAVVYKTDLRVEPSVREAFNFAMTDADPIVYWGAVTKVGSAEAALFLAYLKSEKAIETLRKFGFRTP